MTDAVFIEISPLMELCYTGIPNLTAAIAAYWLEPSKGFDAYFIYEHIIVDPNEIKRAVDLRCGAVLRCQISNGRAIHGYVEDVASRYGRTLGIYCNVKELRDLFDIEYQVIYDLTVLLTPEFHSKGTIEYHGLSLKDLATNRRNLCISECTKDDLETYCNGLVLSSEVHYPGVNQGVVNDVISGSSFNKCGRYIMVAGTVEPRKNADLVLRLVQSDPSILDKYKLVFIGRSGWLINFRASLMKLGLLPALDSKKIVWLNFVDDIERDLLYKGAALSIYASLYEGFGLPVAEAMAFGCPVLVSFASSLPEVGGSAAIYFDPLSLDSLALAFSQYEKSDLPKLKQACVEQASKFSWERFNDGIYKSVVADMELNLDAAS